MTPFYYQNDELFAEGTKVSAIAEEYGTPCYIYSKNKILENVKAFTDSLLNTPHRICYAVKANSNLAILNILNKLKIGFDIVSIGELERILAVGADPKKIVFSGVGKTRAEIQRALEVGIFCFNVESEPELFRIAEIAKANQKIANIALRINPNIDALTHRYIATGLHENKFGIGMDILNRLIQDIQNLPSISLIGIGCHIGSQLTKMSPFLEALDCLIQIAEELQSQGISLQHIDIGGGLGISYRDENPPSISEYINAIQTKCTGLPYEIILEPGRVIVGNAGILMTKVEYLKQTAHTHFAVVDAGMNDILRPALYDAWQNILPVHLQKDLSEINYDIVGPVCESADFLGKNRLLSLSENQLLAICTAGAYGFTMSSNYNSRPRAAEILVDQDKVHLIRKRETIEDLYSHEIII